MTTPYQQFIRRNGGKPAFSRDGESEMLIRMILDYDPSRSAAALRALSFAELAAIYKTLRGY